MKLAQSEMGKNLNYIAMLLFLLCSAAVIAFRIPTANRCVATGRGAASGRGTGQRIECGRLHLARLCQQQRVGGLSLHRLLHGAASSPDFPLAAELPAWRRMDYERSQAAQH